MFTLLGAIAAFERKLILERAAEGRAKAMQHGVKFGRPVTIPSEAGAGTPGFQELGRQQG